jgi:hypothetical protein
MIKPRILIACEFSQVVCKAFRDRGFEAYSCDILPTEGNPEWHIQDDVLKHLNDGWDMMIAHPPCTYLTVTANKWMKPEFKTRFPYREQQRTYAIEFFMKLANAPINSKGLENPIGIMSTYYRKPNQYIQPYEFGHAERKKTCLWLFNLPLLKPTNIVEPISYYAAGKPYSPTHYMSKRSLNHLDYLPPMKDRWKLRSRTFPGIAQAMATQWGDYLLEIKKD